MSPPRQENTNQSNRRTALGTTCPKCASVVSADAKWCPACDFTGADSMAMFPDPAPPLLTLLDAAGIWKEEDVRKIEAAREKLRRRFPQFSFRVCTVALPSGSNLPVFGFWLLNACPFDVNETAGQRSWTVLLLIDVASGKAAVIPGYAAERWISDEDWKKILDSMKSLWKAGRSAQAVIRYFESSASFLDHTWRIRGQRRSKRSKS